MKQLKQWLNQKVSNARQTAQEIGELSSWLLLRKEPRRDSVTPIGSARSARSESSAKLSAKEVVEFFGWLQARAADARLSEHEKRQLNKWIAGRLESGAPLDESAAEEIRRKIGE